LLGNGTVATKELNEALGILENKFNEEVGCLMKTKHKNNLKFLEYCCETRGIIVDHEGKFDKYTTGMSIWPATCLYIFTFMIKNYMVRHLK
jgi:hypothetical protein